MDDEGLVNQALAGEGEAVAALYDRYADRLYDYARRLTGNPNDANDAVHDSFLIAMQRLGQLRDHSRFRPWMYAIVRTEVARKRLRVDRLHFGVWDDPVSTDVAPSRAAEITELQRLIADAADGLSDDDREVLDLHLRHGLTGPEMAAALDIPERHVSVTMQRVRERLGRGLGVVLVGRSPTCAEFAALRTREGGELTELARKRLARHIDGCATCTADRDTRLRPEALLGVIPMALAPAAMRAITLEGAKAGVAASAAAGAASGGAATGAAAGAAGGGRVASEVGRAWLRDGFPTLAVARRAVRMWMAVAVGGTSLVAGTAFIARTDREPQRPRAEAAVSDPAPGRTPEDTVPGSIDATPDTSGSDTSSTDGTLTADTAVVTAAPGSTTPSTASPAGEPGPNTTAPPATSAPVTAIPTTAPAADLAAPIVSNPSLADYRISSQADGVGTCYIETSTVFTVEVTDDVAATSVKIAWVAPGGATRTTTLSASGSAWSGSIGPFPFAEIPPGDVVKYDVTVTARDAAGHTSVVTLTQFGVVDSCPLP